jgi:hypothetical protein
LLKVRDGVVTNRPVYLVIGIDCDDAKQVVGLWVRPTTKESAKFLDVGALRTQEPGRRGRRGRCMAHRPLAHAGPAKYAALDIVSFAATLALYETLVRRFHVTRLLFGIKPNHSSPRSTPLATTRPVPGMHLLGRRD